MIWNLMLLILTFITVYLLANKVLNKNNNDGKS